MMYCGSCVSFLLHLLHRLLLETRYNLACGPEGHVGQVLDTYGAQDLALWDSGAFELNILAWDSVRSLETVQEVSWSYVCEFVKLNIFSPEGDSTYFSCLFVHIGSFLEDFLLSSLEHLKTVLMVENGFCLFCSVGQGTYFKRHPGVYRAVAV